MAIATRVVRPASAAMRQIARPAPMASRGFQTSRRLAADVAPVAVKKPVGAFRGGLLGFFAGSSLTGAGIYYYILDEYKVSNELLTEDIYGLQSTVQRVHGHVQALEEKLDSLEKKK